MRIPLYISTSLGDSTGLRVNLWSLTVAGPMFLPSLRTWSKHPGHDGLIPLTSCQSWLCFQCSRFSPKGTVPSCSTPASTPLSQRHPLGPDVLASSHLLHQHFPCGRATQRSLSHRMGVSLDGRRAKHTGETLGFLSSPFAVLMLSQCPGGSPVFGFSQVCLTHTKALNHTVLPPLRYSLLLNVGVSTSRLSPWPSRLPAPSDVTFSPHVIAGPVSPASALPLWSRSIYAPARVMSPPTQYQQVISSCPQCTFPKTGSAPCLGGGRLRAPPATSQSPRLSLLTHLPLIYHIC